MKSCLRFAVVVVLSCGGCNMGEGVTPLMKASRSGEMTTLRNLVGDGADINKTSRYGWTALMFAAREGHGEAVEFLLGAGADPNVISKHIPSRFETTTGYPSTTALREAIREDHIDIANILLDGGATVDPEVVSLAGQAGDTSLLERFLQLGADVNATSGDAFHASALCSASSARKLDAVKWLISNGADPNLIAEGQTALEVAAEADEVEVVRYLLDNGADPNLVYGILEKTALFTATTKHTDRHNYPANLEIVSVLLARGADRSHRAFGGQYTALEFVKIQRENVLKCIPTAENDEIRKQHEPCLSHMDAIVDLLQK